jgi:Trypsin-co-occurring domain 1
MRQPETTPSQPDPGRAAYPYVNEGNTMPPKVVTYALDNGTKVRFEIDPPPGFQDAGAEKVIGKVQEALTPAVDTAKLILDKIKEASPDEITVTFGLKVSGNIDWFIARASTESNFQITLAWKAKETDSQ